MADPKPIVEQLKRETGALELSPGVQQIVRERDALLRSGILGAQQQAPDQAARALALKRRLPPNPAPGALDVAERQEKLQAIPYERLRQIPALGRFASDPDRAAAASDDFDALIGFADAVAPQSKPEVKGSLLEVLSARTSRGRATIDLADAGFAALLDSSPKNLAVLDTRKSQLAGIEVPEGSTFADWTGAAAEMLPLLFDQGASAIAAGAVGAAGAAGLTAIAGQLGPQVAAPEEIVTVPAAALAGFAIGAPLGSATRIFKIESGGAYADFRDLTDEAGQPLPEAALKGAAIAVGGLNAGLELVGLKFLISAFPGGKKVLQSGTREGAKVAMREALRASPGLRSALARVGQDYVTSVAVETTTEVAQGVIEESAAAILDESFGGGQRDFDVTGPLLEGVEAFKATVVLGGIGGGARTVVDTTRSVQQSKQYAARLEEIERVAATSKLRERAPEAFAELADDLAAEGGIEAVNVPAQVLVDQAQAASVDLRELPEALQQKIGEAALLGGDARFAMGEWLTQVPEALRKKLLPEVRSQSEAMSLVEAEQAEKAVTKQLEALGKDESQAAVEAELGPAPAAPLALRIFKSADEAGMSEEQFATFEAAREQSWRIEAGKLEPQIRGEEGRRSAAIRKAEREARSADRASRTQIQTEVEAQLSASPTWRMRAWIERGQITRVEDMETVGMLDADKLDTDVLRERYPAKAGLIPRNLTRSGGLDPEIAAQLFGFGSVDAMVDALIESRGTLEQATKAQVEARMIESRGEPGTAVAEARESAERAIPAQDDRLNFLLLEERALSKRSGRSALTTRAAKEVARRLIAEKPINQIRPASYRAAATRQSLLALEAARKGDFQAASDAKRRQILNVFLESEGRAARDRVSKDVAAIRKLDQKPARDRLASAKRGHLEQHDGLLEGFRLRGSVSGLKREQTLERWIAERETEGDAVVIPDKIRARVSGAGEQMHWSELTPEDLAGLRQSVENISELAKRWLEVQTARETRLRDEVVADLQREAEQGILRKAKRSNRASAGPSDRARSFLRSIDASLTQTEFLVDVLGSSSPTSTWREAILNPLLDAQDAFNETWKAYGEKIADIMDGYDQKTKRSYRKLLDETRLQDTDGRPLELAKWNLIMVALNTGNASNLDKLLRGYGWNEQQMMEVLDTHLSKKDWQLVQNIWDAIDGLWPQIEAMEKRITGVAPPKIKTESVSTRFGTFKGGYFPVVYDPERSALGSRIEQFDVWGAQPGGFARANTGHGHTKERTNVARPILLETSVIAKHLNDVILDLTHREAVTGVGKLLADPRVDETMKQTLGREFSYSKFWLPQLQTIAKNVANPGPVDIWNRVIRQMRLNASVFKLGFRASTLLMQSGGNINGFRTLREQLPQLSNVQVARFWARGMYQAMDRFGGNMGATRGVLESSAFMRNRIKALDRDAREIMSSNAITRTATDKFREFAMGLIGRTQLYTVDMPTWIASRQAGVEALGLSEDESGRFADSVVRMSQGSGEVISQSSVVRGGPNGAEWLKAATLFYSYNNTVYNQLRRAGRIRPVRAVGPFVAAYAFYVIGPALFAEAMRSLVREFEGNITGDDRDDEDSERRMAAKLADILVGDGVATVPVVRDLWGATIAAIDPSQRYRGEPSTATGVAMEEMVRAGQAFDSEDGARTMIAAARGMTFLMGLPGDWMLRLAERAAKDD